MSRKSMTFIPSPQELPKVTVLSWSKEDDDFIVRQRNEKGRLWVAIALSLTTENTIRSADDVRLRYNEVMHKILYGRSLSKPTRTRCLGHGPVHYFTSPDKRKIRICPVCKENNRYVSEGYAVGLPTDNNDHEPNESGDGEDYSSEPVNSVTLFDLEERDWAPADFHLASTTSKVK